MPLIMPFAGLRPAAGRASDVAAPPYDVLNSEEARARAAGKPWSFLHISKPEIDLPVGTDPYAAEVYQQGAASFQKMLDAGVLVRDSQPCYYLYRLVMGSHQQTGLVVAASVADYDSNRIRKHEFTRPDKEDDRVRQIESLQAQTGPVFLTYRHHAVIDALVTELTAGEAAVDITADDGIQHTLWVVSDRHAIDTISATFDAMPALYIADGHHRSAAASRVAAARRSSDPTPATERSSDYFLAVAFPDNQMQILDYNRVISDLNALTPDQLLAAIGERFRVTPAAAAVKPSRSGEFGMYLAGQWYRLTIDPTRIPADPVASLDVSLLQQQLIAPLLGIEDPRRDKRIDFVGGIRGLGELERRVDSGNMALAFSLYPTTLSQLMAVADADQVMPPKSTWFEPKLADGLVSHPLD